MKTLITKNYIPTERFKVSWRRKKSKRYDFLDHFRGIMIFCMILNHSAYYFWHGSEQNYYIRFLLWSNFFIAANFLMISGFAFNYYSYFRKIKVVKKSLFFRETFLRAILIYGIATVISMLFGRLGGLDDSWAHWSIFKIIGLGMVILLVLDFLPRSEFWLTAIMVTLFFLGYLSTVIDIALLNFFSRGAFAFFPWFNFFGFGFVLGKFLIRYDETGLDFSRLKKILPLALVLILFFAIPFIRYNLDTYIELNLKLFLGNIGLFFWFLAAFYYLTRKPMRSKIKRLIDQITEYGKMSFSLYYLQFGLIFVVLLINSVLTEKSVICGEDCFVFMNTWLFTVIVVLLLSILSAACFFWKKIDYVMSLEWFIHKFLNMALKE